MVILDQTLIKGGIREEMLFAIGGSLDCQGEMQILKRLLKEARDNQSSVCIVTTATSYPDQARKLYADTFAALDVKDCTILHIDSRAEAESAEALHAVRRADIVFFTGGDQLKLAKTLSGTAFMEAVNENFRQGRIIAGTSAGAAAMSKQMIYAVQRRENGKYKGKHVFLENGFGLSEELILDTHFSERRRLTRLFTMVSQNPACMGLGVDENTAAILKKDGTVEIIGAGTVTIVHGDQAAAKKSGKMPRQVLRHGEIYDLRKKDHFRP